MKTQRHIKRSAVLMAFVSFSVQFGALRLAVLLAAASALSATEARRIFADLLKISAAPPPVAVSVQSSNDEEGLLIQDVSWESLDQQRPTAFVIRPKEGRGPFPAIICLHGTGGSRESETTRTFGEGDWLRPGDKVPHQRLLGWARELSRHGYLTLSLTQRGLDRRTPDTNDQAKAMLVGGRTLMGAIVYEIRQAITYLRQRPDVDRARIGITGMSFGGITAFYTWLADDRIAAAAPICGGVGSVQSLLERGTPAYHGLYWWIPGMLQKGDQAYFAAAMAPRPLMLWAPQQDIGMPKQGVDAFIGIVRPAYLKAGAPDALVIHQPPGEHRFTLEAFASMKAFFDNQLKTKGKL